MSPDVTASHRRDRAAPSTWAVRLAGVACVLVLIGSGVVGCQWLFGWPLREMFEVRPESIREVEGRGVRFKLPGRCRWRPVLAEATIRVHEDGHRLPEVSGKAHVVKSGLGRYAIRDTDVWFSASDGTLPSENGRRYQVSISW